MRVGYDASYKLTLFFTKPKTNKLKKSLIYTISKYVQNLHQDIFSKERVQCN